ncbi:hypothetical protein AMECASPLE_000407 [Ameca splendens]|uniref:Uncharacterized protein n=1 Tax=Ameca splendens TaxID=208324 RepID=A0ABV0ZTF8_9TELE
MATFKGSKAAIVIFHHCSKSYVIYISVGDGPNLWKNIKEKFVGDELLLRSDLYLQLSLFDLIHCRKMPTSQHNCHTVSWPKGKYQTLGVEPPIQSSQLLVLFWQYFTTDGFDD